MEIICMVKNDEENLNEQDTENFNKETTNMAFLTPQEAGQKIDKLVRDYLFQHPELSYERALDLILDKYPDLKAAYARGVAWPDKTQSPEYVNPKRKMDWYLEDHSGEYEDPREEVDRRVKVFQMKNPSCDYEAAFHVVLSEDPELAEAYSKS